MTAVTATRLRHSKLRWILPLAALLLTALVVLPPLISLRSFHRSIAESISQGIGRPVKMSSIKMHLLPRPGFEIQDFVVEEDPGFGAEPILHCAEVNAYLRLFPLWRGKIEIARIGFDEPSVNLVRNKQGKWNFDSLLSQAAQLPKAPTGERHAGSLPRFPYIDASNARVNFKFGDEKMPFSFFNADLAVWLENPGEWRIQFAAQPVRTDLSLDLADTGILRLDGSLRRAPTLSEMPARLHAEWSSAPLGQLSRIFTGSDANWRGDLDASADVTGTVSGAEIKLVARAQGIHRIEFEPRESLNIDLTCQARFARGERPDHHLDRFFDAITCLVPTGGGHLLLTGNVHGLTHKIDPALSLEINNLPVATALEGLRLMRAGFAPDLQATGAIDGRFIYAGSPAFPDPQLDGQAVVHPLTVASPALEKPMSLPELHLQMNTETASNPIRRVRMPHGGQPLPVPAQSTLLLNSFSLVPSMTPRSPLNLDGAFTRSSFNIHVAGQARVGPLAALGRAFRLLRDRNVSFGQQGTAEVDLNIHGPWVMPVSDPEHPVAPARLEGNVHLHNAIITTGFLAQPMQIGSAQATLADGSINWTASSIGYGPIHGDGSLSYPIFCMTAQCTQQFTLHLGALDAATAQSALLGGQRHGELVQELLSRLGTGDPVWPALNGTVQIGTLTISAMSLHDVSASLNVKDNVAHMTSMTARTLDGTLRLSGNLLVANGAPSYEIEADLDHASIAATAAMFQENWGPGAIHLKTSLRFSGFEAAQLISSATGNFHWDWTKGGLPHFSGPETDPAQTALTHFDAWIADGTIGKEQFNLAKSKIVAPDMIMPLSGTIGFHRELKLQSSGPGATLTILGTLPKPEVNSGLTKTASIP